MYERYTENARRALTLAKLEAAETGSAEIESHHLLQGIITGDRDLIQNALGNFSRDAIQEQLLRKRRSGTASRESEDIPLSGECKRVLAAAEEEADRHGDAKVGGQHILLGLLREAKGFTAQQLKTNVRAEEVRQRLGFEAAEPQSGGLFGKLRRTLSGEK
jgi:ATP-dependent Clp protease ATP-binding subunit ClpC